MEEAGAEREGWRFFTVELGEQFVMTAGMQTTGKSPAAHLDTPTHHMLYNLPSSDKEVAGYGWTILTAWGTKVHWKVVPTMEWALITAATMKMHRSFV